MRYDVHDLFAREDKETFMEKVKPLFTFNFYLFLNLGIVDT